MCNIVVQNTLFVLCSYQIVAKLQSALTIEGPSLPHKGITDCMKCARPCRTPQTTSATSTASLANGQRNICKTENVHAV